VPRSPALQPSRSLPLLRNAIVRIAPRPGEIQNNLRGGAVWPAAGIALVLDGREGAEHEVADVGQDGGAAGGDLVVGEVAVQLAEGVMDAGGGLKPFRLAGEGGGEAGGILGGFAVDGVAVAEAGVGVGDGEAAMAGS